MNTPLIHPSLLFRFETPVLETAAPAADSAWRLGEQYRLPNFLRLDGQPAAADVQFAMGWAPTGLLLQWSIDAAGQKKSPGKSKPPNYLNTGRIQFWVDSRGSVGIHRLTSTCSHFEFSFNTVTQSIDVIALGSGRRRGSETGSQTVESDLRSHIEVEKGTVVIRASISSTALPGYQPDEFRNISYFYELLCGDGRIVPAAVGSQMRYDLDPNLWIRGVLKKTPA